MRRVSISRLVDGHIRLVPRRFSAMPADRPPLASRGSKSRLSKQAEVESEDPPQSNAAKIAIPETRVESFEMASDSADSSPLLKSKVLVRSHALCGDDDTKLKARALEKQCSSKSGSATSSLSRDSSNEMYTDSTGINLEDFIATTLHKNAKDRQMLLQLEDELRRFVVDNAKQVQKFPPMSSYNRMLVHRISAFFGLDHNVDQNGTAVVVNKTSQTRLPDIEFSHYIRSDRFTDEPKRYLRRDVQSYEEVRGDGGLLEYRKARSFEVCEDDQERNRTTRFFPQDSTSSTDGVMESPMSGYSSENYVDTGVARPWSSTDSHSSSLDVPPLHGAVMQKAGSFGGMSVGYRQHGDSLHHPRAPAARRSNTGGTLEQSGHESGDGTAAVHSRRVGHGRESGALERRRISAAHGRFRTAGHLRRRQYGPSAARRHDSQPAHGAAIHDGAGNGVPVQPVRADAGGTDAGRSDAAARHAIQPDGAGGRDDDGCAYAGDDDRTFVARRPAAALHSARVYLRRSPNDRPAAAFWPAVARPPSLRSRPTAIHSRRCSHPLSATADGDGQCTVLHADGDDAGDLLAFHRRRSFAGDLRSDWWRISHLLDRQRPRRPLCASAFERPRLQRRFVVRPDVRKDGRRDDGQLI